MVPLILLSGKCILVKKLRLPMQGGTIPVRFSEGRSSATTRGVAPCTVLHVTPCHWQKLWESSRHVANVPAVRLLARLDLRQRSVCRSASELFEDGAEASRECVQGKKANRRVSRRSSGDKDDFMWDANCLMRLFLPD
jgi:hypothetical protein